MSFHEFKLVNQFTEGDISTNTPFVQTAHRYESDNELTSNKWWVKKLQQIGKLKIIMAHRVTHLQQNNIYIYNSL
jgi:hypothetical protein